jgi:hypothetical protein
MTTAAILLATMLAYVLGRIGRARAAEEELDVMEGTIATPQDARTDLAPKATRSEGEATPTSTAEVKAAWAATYAAVGALFPDFEVRLAQLSKRHPVQGRRLGRVAGSAGRASGRVLRGEAQRPDLLARLRRFERVVTNTLERHQ